MKYSWEMIEVIITLSIATIIVCYAVYLEIKNLMLRRKPKIIKLDDYYIIQTGINHYVVSPYGNGLYLNNKKDKRILRLDTMEEAKEVIEKYYTHRGINYFNH